MKTQFTQQRCAGVLLHITSLPNRDLGSDAYRFVDFLVEAGITIWQILPLGPVLKDLSPYQCLSAYAGNPDLISLQALVDEPWFIIPASSIDLSNRKWVLNQAYRYFTAYASKEDRERFAAFCHDQFWLEDYALFQALRESQNDSPWFKWSPNLRKREPQALKAAAKRLRILVEKNCFEQFIFFQQWLNLKDYANRHGILILGDMPIFVAHDSADVWIQPTYFTLDENSQLITVAGVPPDYFSATGQRWGNPLYRWDRIAADKFQWWTKRIGTTLKLCDMVRLDHFRGFESYWEIPASSEIAADGRWVKAPGMALFHALEACYGALPIVAEDLGIITPEVKVLRDQFHFPGMKILQFAFEGGIDNPYLPSHHVENCVVYTGTHDNDTTLGWFDNLPDEKRYYVYESLGFPAMPMPWALIDCAFKSVARYAVVPLQDILALGSEGRMNIPGRAEGNWRWCFNWSQIEQDLPARIYHLLKNYNRL